MSIIKGNTTGKRPEKVYHFALETLVGKRNKTGRPRRTTKTLLTNTLKH